MEEKFGLYQKTFDGGEVIFLSDTHKELDDAWNVFSEHGRKRRGMKKVKVSWRVI